MNPLPKGLRAALICLTLLIAVAAQGQAAQGQAAQGQATQGQAAQGRDAQRQDAAHGQDAIQTLYRYLDQAAQDHQFNGNILLARDGRVVYKRSYGYSDFPNESPLNDSSQFPLASISKTFTAVAILQLLEKGKLKLDDPYKRYFPAFPYPTITIRQLLSHTSGLPDDLFDRPVAQNPDKIYTNADDLPTIRDYAKTRSLLFTPGERWSYCSFGYQLLADLVGKLSNEPFPAYLKKHVFIPAGMLSTYVQTSLTQTKEPHRTENYLYNNHYEMKLQLGDTVADKREWAYNLSGGVGAGNVVSTTGDLLRYDEALYNGVLLKPATLELAFTPTKVNNGGFSHAASGSSEGLGWFIFGDTGRGTIVWHSGAAPGVVTLFARNISRHETFIILANVVYDPSMYRDLLDIINDKQLEYRKSLGFLFARDLYRQGIDYAVAHLDLLKSDTTQYTLREDNFERAALEFSRDYWHSQNLALQTYELMTFLYPKDAHIYRLYADLLSTGRVRNKDAAILLYKHALELDPADEKSKARLEQMLGPNR
ncbi:MAG TPA: serine hydrolase domain-containing protein [Puia sp.]|nr:serine hydrolase domain-containing protein [Puia sp.]